MFPRSQATSRMPKPSLFLSEGWDGTKPGPRITPRKRPIATRSLPEILPNFAAMVTAKICAIPRNVCESLTTSYTQQKCAQVMPRTQLIPLGGLACPPQIPVRLRSGARYPYRCQISRSVTAYQLQGIPSISLDPVASLDRSQRLRNNLNNCY
jgi:hypothetical protein